MALWPSRKKGARGRCLAVREPRMRAAHRTAPHGRLAVYCGPVCRQAARRERLRLAEAKRQRAERPGADPAVPDQYRGATQPAVLPAREHAAHQAAPIPREVDGAVTPLVMKQLIARAGHQGSPDGQAGQPAPTPVIRGCRRRPGRSAGLWDSGATSMAALGVDGRLSGKRLDDSPVVHAGIRRGPAFVHRIGICNVECQDVWGRKAAR